VDHGALGARGEPFEMDVERGKVRELGRALLSDLPAYRGLDGLVVPPTFFTTMFLWEPDETNPWHLLDIAPGRGLHGSQEYEFPGPPPSPGARLVGQTRIDQIYERQGRRGGTLTFAEVVTDFHDAAGGDLVARSRLTVVETERPPDRAPADGSTESSPPPADEPTSDESTSDESTSDEVAAGSPGAAPPPPGRPGGPVGTRCGWDDLVVGAEGLEQVVGPIDRTDIVRYEGASGFFNPVHHDEPYAQRAGFPTPFSVGMFQAGLWAVWATAWLGPEHVRRVRFRFREQVWPGDALVLSGQVAARHDGGGIEGDGERRVELVGTCRRRGGGVAVEAEATFAVP
jgi:acyl dehydratase